MTGRGRRGRRVALLVLLAVLALDATLALLVDSAPKGMGGPWVEDVSHLGWFILAIGASLHLAGLAWMLRIYRADPEAHPSYWRFARS